MKKFFIFLLECMKLSLKVWVGNILIVIILLPLEIALIIYIIKLINAYFGIGG